VEPPERPPSSQDSDDAQPPDVFQEGEVLAGVYEIRSELGRGARGQVFEAYDRALQRRVAIKVAWPEVSSEQIRKEAQALAAIRHSGVVGVYAVGTHEKKEFVVMERLYGMSLEAHLEGSGDDLLPLEETLGILTSIAEALVAVHRAGLAHRDIKAANVVLAPGERVILVDFGLVLPEVDVRDRAKITGSPLYMAPEVISNRVEPGHGHLVDLYSLGVLAFEMLTGEAPFSGDTVKDVFMHHLKTPPPPLTSYRADLAPRLVDLVASMLAKDPAARPQSAEAVVWALRHLSREAAARKLIPFSVLIVDDDVHVARVLSFYVSKAVPDADVRVATGGDEALRLVRRNPPHLMLLDLNMPKMTGIEVCMFLRGTRMAEGCTIVSVSAGAQPKDVQLLQLLGVAHFVQKGQDLGEKIAKIVGEIYELTRDRRYVTDISGLRENS
jgi:serine/threonine protein kinase